MAHETVKYLDRIVRPADTTIDGTVAAQPDRPALDVSPQDFYAEITKRLDVSELMCRLAR